MNVKYPFTSTFLDYPDNESIAVLVYFMGCEQNCKGCHNPDFKNVDYNIGTKNLSEDSIIEEIEIQCKRNLTNKVVLSGGDPLHPANINGVKNILDKIGMKYDFCLYTSYEKCYIIESKISGFSFVKSGIFIEDLYQEPDKTDENIKFASKNQKLYDADLNLISENGIYFFR